MKTRIISVLSVLLLLILTTDGLFAQRQNDNGDTNETCVVRNGNQEVGTWKLMAGGALIDSGSLNPGDDDKKDSNLWERTKIGVGLFLCNPELVISVVVQMLRKEYEFASIIFLPYEEQPWEKVTYRLQKVGQDYLVIESYGCKDEDEE